MAEGMEERCSLAAEGYRDAIISSLGTASLGMASIQ